MGASSVSINVMLLFKREQQHLVFFTIKTLLDKEICYTTAEKLVLALTQAATKLKYYFESDKIIIVTSYHCNLPYLN